MPVFHSDPENHLISATVTSRADAVLTRLSEGFFTTDHKASGRNPKLWSLMRAADEISSPFFRFALMKKYHIVPNRIVFAAYQGNYVCNCKYIADEILRQGLDYELIFLVDPEVYQNRSAYNIPDSVYLVKKNTAEAFYALATSRFWIDNALNCIWKPVPKKKEQIYINTWHGSLGIKKLGGGLYWKMIARIGNRQMDVFLTNSRFDEKVFRTSFWPNVSHLKIGHPRNDLLLNKERMLVVKKEIYEKYHLTDDIKLALYAPTFRSNGKDQSAVQADYSLLLSSLKSRFGGEWRILSRLHYKNKDQMTDSAIENPYVINATNHPDMQELLAACDAGITDYSSWIFDYLFTGRPGFIYATDIENYIHDRGFYYSLDKTPFSIASSDEQLAEQIQSFDEVAYSQKVQRFLKRMGCYETGTACEEMVRYIREHS